MRRLLVTFSNTWSLRARSLALAALPAAALAIIIVGTYLTGAEEASAQSDASMRLTVSSGGQCDGNRCTVPLGGNFTLRVVIDQAPAEGYILAQTFIDFGRRLTYNMTEEQIDEILWPDCAPPVALRAQVHPETVLHGCITALIPPLPVSTYTGTFAELSFTCSPDPSTTNIRLLPYEDEIARTNGNLFVLDGGVEQVVPPLNILTLNCGQGSTLEPTYTPRAPNGQQAISTPEPADPPGVPDGIGGPLDDDAQATADAAATPTDDGTPEDARDEDDEEEEDDNGGGNMVLIIAIIAAALALAAGGGGYYLWRQRTAQGGSSGEGSG